MGVCASSGACSTTTRWSRAWTHIVRWTCTCPACPPTPEMLMDAFQIHAKIMDEPLGSKRRQRWPPAHHTELIPRRSSTPRSEFDVSELNSSRTPAGEHSSAERRRRRSGRHRAHPSDLQEAPGAAAGRRARAGRMFGVHDSGDTSGSVDCGCRPIPGSGRAPYGGWFDDFADEFGRQPGRAGHPRQRDPPGHRGPRRDHLSCTGPDPRTLPDDCGFEGLRFELLSSLSGWTTGEAVRDRLHVVYHLLSMTTAGGSGWRSRSPWRTRTASVGKVYRQRTGRNGRLGHVRGDLRRSPALTGS